MFGSEVLEVAVGVIFVYILVSTACAAVREGIEAWRKTRAAYLDYGIRELLNDLMARGIAKSLYEHPIIYGLFSGTYPQPKSDKRPWALSSGKNLPSYIPAKNFALALMDLAARGLDTGAAGDPSPAAITPDLIRDNLVKLGNPAVQRALLTAIDAARGDINKVQENIEAWYNSGMDRVSGWYKRSTQWIILVVGLIAAVGLNVNTLSITDFLYRNAGARAALVAKAEADAAATAPGAKTPSPGASYEEAMKRLNSLNLPIGWQGGWKAARLGDGRGVWNDLFAPILGWLMTALAATLGAPFWFDVLNKVMVIRSTVKPHEKSPEEASEDRQATGQRLIAVVPSSAGVGAGGGNGSATGASSS